MSDEDICYICHDEFTQSDAIYDAGCNCSHTMHTHYSCIKRLCETTANIHCTICKTPYKELEVVIAEYTPYHIDYTTYSNGMKNGLTTRVDRQTKFIIARHYYTDNNMTEAHEFSEVTGSLDFILRFDPEGRVTEYTRYNSWGEEVDYEDYSENKTRQFEITAAAAYECV
jgi:hypothetical protein